MNKNGNEVLTFWGASPVIFLLTILYAVFVIIMNNFFKPVFEIDFIPDKILITIAVCLLCIGIPLYIATIKILKSAFNKEKLEINGIFSLCRNPLFAVVIFFLLPGIILFFNSWLLLTIPCFMYIMFKIFIKREEHLLAKKFGQEYIEYKNSTSAIFPKIWKFKK